jgi:hypothetical protein
MQCYCCTLLIAIGDCTLVDVEFEDAHWANPELTPVAIIAGQLLAGRLFGKQTDKMDYTKVSFSLHIMSLFNNCSCKLAICATALCHGP